MALDLVSLNGECRDHFWSHEFEVRIESFEASCSVVGNQAELRCQSGYRGSAGANLFRRIRNDRSLFEDLTLLRPRSIEVVIANDEYAKQSSWSDQIFEAAMVFLRGGNSDCSRLSNQLLQRQRSLRTRSEGIELQNNRRLAEAANALAASCRPHRI